MKPISSFFYMIISFSFLFEQYSWAGKISNDALEGLEQAKGGQFCALKAIKEGAEKSITKHELGSTFVVQINSVAPNNIGKIAVEIRLPTSPRYESEGPPVLLEVPTFLTPTNGFYRTISNYDLGAVYAAMLYPGTSGDSGGVTYTSEGAFDAGGENSIQALRDVVRYLTGVIADSDGNCISEVIEGTVLTDEVGLYAFSHPGIAAINLLSEYGSNVKKLAWYVGRENPTTDTITAVELGFYDDRNVPHINPLYSSTSSYSDDKITIDYSTVNFDRSKSLPYFDLDGNGKYNSKVDFMLGKAIPSVDGVNYYSTALTMALSKNLGKGRWPKTIATVKQAKSLWDYVTTKGKFELIGSELPDLKVMLLFADRDHVQPTPDKPHVKQAFNGFSSGGNWIRLNPDKKYMKCIDSTMGDNSPDNDANSGPTDWDTSSTWAFSYNSIGIIPVAQAAPAAAIAEMLDRTHEDNWSNNLNNVLNRFNCPITLSLPTAIKVEK